MATKTLWDIKNEMYGLMNMTSDNTTYTQNGRDTNKINDVIRRVCSWFFRSALNPETVYKSGDIPFLRNKQYFKYKESVACTANIAVWAITITIDTTNFTTAGYIYSQGIVIKYTGKNATQLTGVTWVIADFDEWTQFEQVYLISADMDKPYRVFKMDGSKEVDVRERKSQDDRYQREYGQAFTILYDETTGLKFMRFIGASKDDRFLLKYYKTIELLEDDTDITDVPDEYSLSVIAPIAAGEMLMESQSEDVEYINKLTLWYSKLEEMYNKFTTAVKDMDQIAKQRPYNWVTIAWWVSRDGYTNSGFKVY